MNKSTLAKWLSLGLVANLLLSACAPVAPAGGGAAAEPTKAAAEEPAAEPAQAETAAGGCNVEAPAAAVEINMIGWSFPIMDFYAAELAKYGEVEHITVNTNLLASADAQEQVRLALSAGGDSPYDIVHGANGQVAEWGGAGWLLPLNELVEKYREQYNLDDIPAKAWEGATFEDFHQRPWLVAYLDRQVQDLTALFAEGYYSGAPGWAGVKATHSGPYLDALATGNAIAFNGLDWWKRQGEQYVENWVFVDMIHLFRQFGIDLLARLAEQKS